MVPTRILCALLILVSIAGCRSAVPTSEAEPDASPRIIAYVVGWKPISVEDPRRLTHINYAFATIDDDRIIVLENEQAPRHLAHLNALKDDNQRLKIVLSVGGWGADRFSDAALTPDSRDRFARSAVRLVTQYDLDGIDIDWEYPGRSGAGITARPEDKQNFTLMLQELRRQLDELSAARNRSGSDRYTLSIASTHGLYFDHTEMDVLHHYLDWINIMAYDFFGEWSEVTGHHTALYPSAHEDGPSVSAEASVRQHLEAGIPSNKLVLGVAFYGRGWTGVNAEQNGLNQPFERSTGSYSYSRLKQDYVNRRGFQRLWDPAAKAPYLWNPDSTTFITYDDPESLKHKAEFVRDHKLGGMMYWEHAHDADEELLQTLNRHLRPPL